MALLGQALLADSTDSDAPMAQIAISLWIMECKLLSLDMLKDSCAIFCNLIFFF